MLARLAVGATILLAVAAAVVPVPALVPAPVVGLVTPAADAATLAAALDILPMVI